MAIINAWTSPADFDTVGGFTVITSAAQIAPYAKEGTWVSSTLGIARVTFSALSSLWLQFYFYSDIFGGATGDIVNIKDTETGTILFQIGSTSSGSLLTLRYWNGSSFVSVAVASRVHSNNTRYKFDINLVISDTVGIFNIYLNDVLVLSYTGDTKWTSATTVSCIEFLNGYTSSFWYNYSGVILADEDTRALVFHQEQPTANGANTAWTGGYTDVAKLTRNDSTFIESGTANQVETYTSGDVNSALNSHTVKAVVLALRARKGSTGPQNLQGAVRQSGADYFSSNVGALSAAFASKNAVMLVNPATSATWTISEINAAEFGVKSIT